MGFLSKTKVVASDFQYTSSVKLNIMDKLIVDNIDLNDNTDRYIDLDDVDVKWSVTIDQKISGIEALNIHVDDQTIPITGYYEKDNSEEVIDTKISITNAKAEVMKARFQGIYPTELTYYQGKWSLDFE